MLACEVWDAMMLMVSLASLTQKPLASLEIAFCLLLSTFLLIVKEMASHSSILAWRIHWAEKPGRLLSIGLLESETTSDQTTTTICVPVVYFPHCFRKLLKWLYLVPLHFLFFFLRENVEIHLAAMLLVLDYSCILSYLDCYHLLWPKMVSKMGLRKESCLN